MSAEWKAVTAADVVPGDRVRLGSGVELTATRVEPGFMGMAALVAFIEDTPERWFKQPVPSSTEVEVLRGP